MAASPTEAAIMQMETDGPPQASRRNMRRSSGSWPRTGWVRTSLNDKHTRAGFITVLKAGDLVIKSEKMGPMTVRVMGDVAVAQGSEDEVSSWKGKDTSGKYNYTDVFAKRDGKWQAVASQSSKIKA